MNTVPRRLACSLLKDSMGQRRAFQHISRHLSSQFFNGVDNKSGNPELFRLQNQRRMAFTAKWIPTQDESHDILVVWSEMIKDLKGVIDLLEIPDVSEWVAEAMTYNTIPGPKRVVTVVADVFESIAPAEMKTDENRKLATILGWCSELVHGHAMVLDDLLDGSEFRRNQLCWHRKENVGLTAINDSNALDDMVYQILRFYFRGKECYPHLVKAFQDKTFGPTLSHSLETEYLWSPEKKDLSVFSEKIRHQLAELKTSFFVFCMPMELLLRFLGFKDPKVYRTVDDWARAVGMYHQIENDYMNCYVDAKWASKVGSDIADGKCCWPAIVALQRATPAQKEIFVDCYGQKDPSKVMKIKQLYDEIGVPAIFQAKKKECYENARALVEQIPSEIPKDIFYYITEKYFA